MAQERIKVGQVVISEGLVGVYRVVAIAPDEQTADIEKFDVSRQASVGDPVRSLAINKLSAYTEDASQSAARIVREAATED
jgi:glucokinase